MNYFYPNVCHVCKVYGKDIRLITCNKCRMISYCSERHERLHWPVHKEICDAILNVRESKKLTFLKKSTQNLTSDAWLISRMEFMDAVMAKMGRRLKIHEEQMFLYPKACDVCHVQYDDVKYLFTCEHCPSSNLCSEHSTNYEHLKYCRLLSLAYHIERISSDLFMKFINLDYLPNIGAENRPLNMSSFVHTYVLSDQHEEMSLDLQKMWAAVHSDYISPPLTLFFAMQKIQYHLTSENLVVHVIGASPMLVIHRQPWEILLHLKPKLKSLLVIMIGINLDNLSANDLLCSKCKSEKKKLSFQTVGGSYCNYTTEISFRSPDLIIGFNIGLHKSPKETFSATNTWIKMMQMINKQNCPYILSSHNKKWLELEEFKLSNNSLKRNNLVTQYCGKNEFGGLRPYRDYYDEIIRYCNSYIIIYDNKSKSTPTTLDDHDKGFLNSFNKLQYRHYLSLFNRETLSANMPLLSFNTRT